MWLGPKSKYIDIFQVRFVLFGYLMIEDQGEPSWLTAENDSLLVECVVKTSTAACSLHDHHMSRLWLQKRKMVEPHVQDVFSIHFCTVVRSGDLLFHLYVQTMIHT